MISRYNGEHERSRACRVEPAERHDVVVGAHRVELSERLVAELDATWGETITADLGIPSYEALLEMLATGS